MKIKLQNFIMNYIKVGKGKPLILIHGNGEDYHIFDESIKELQNFFTVYAIDLRGHGQSDFDGDLLSYQDMADDLYEFIKLNNIESPIICGYSDGAIIALKMAIKHSFTEAKLILCGVNTSPLGYKDKVLPECEVILKQLENKNEIRCIKLLFTDPCITTADLNNLSNDVCLVFGENDCIKLEHEEYLKNNIPNSRFLLLEGENHESYICGSKKIGEIINNGKYSEK